ncbi:Carboxylesterase 5A [Sporothrix stenoceras]
MKSDETPRLGEVKLEVPDLSAVTGVSLNGETCQYLDIPYAEVPGRAGSGARPWLEVPGTDEFKCLNLNISVPRLPTTDAKTKLPVMAFLHGGKATIVVTVNYALGVLGFLAGTDLRDTNAKEHNEEGVGNYGVWGQVLALRWVQQHIGAFGGDASQVTLFWQSADGVSTHAHLLRSEKLLSSAILQSGLLRTCGILSVDEF